MGSMAYLITSWVFTQPLIQAQIKETPKLPVTDLCAGNSPGTDEFPAQMASNAENVSIWWRHHVPMVRCSDMNYIPYKLDWFVAFPGKCPKTK